MLQRLRHVGPIGLKVFSRFGEHRGSFLAAGIAYHVFFAFFPLILGLVALLGAVLSPSWAETLIMRVVGSSLPVNSEMVHGALETLGRDRQAVGVLAGLLLLWSGKNAFASLGEAMDALHDLPVLGFWAGLQRQGIATLFALALGGAVAAQSGLRWTLALVANLVLPFLGLAPGRLAGALVAIDVVAPLALMVIALLLMYSWLPSRPAAATPRLVGTLFAAVGWEITHQLFGFYLARFTSFSVVYGPLAGAIALLFWIYISAAIVLLGAELALVLEEADRA